MKLIKVLMIISLLTSACNWGDTGVNTAYCQPRCSVVVTEVLSGNEIIIDTGQKLMMSGISVYPITSPFGEAEHECLTDLIEGKRVQLTVHGWDDNDNRLASISSHRVTCPRRKIIEKVKEKEKEK